MHREAYMHTFIHSTLIILCIVNACASVYFRYESISINQAISEYLENGAKHTDAEILLMFMSSMKSEIWSIRSSIVALFFLVVMLMHQQRKHSSQSQQDTSRTT